MAQAPLGAQDLVSVDSDLLRVHFRRFDSDAYGLFLRCKRMPESTTRFNPADETYTVEAPARFAPLLGVEMPKAGAQALPLAEHLYDDQREVTQLALASKRFACWLGCGRGKTPISLEYARHVIHRTGGRVLITTLNEIVPQWLDEARKFYGDTLPLRRLRSRQEMREWMRHGPDSLAITNYEKWTPESLDDQVVSEARLLAGIVLDEADRLRASGGKQKWALIKSCRGIEYKLLATATPAPNDLMEFASQASFLEKMRSEGDIIWTFFVRDNKTHRWTVKPHARKAFFEFMAGWSIYVDDPRRYGWRKGTPDIPEPVIIRHDLAMTDAQREWLARFSADPSGQKQLPGMNDRDTNAIQRNKLSQVAKGFCYRAAGKVAYDRVPSLKPAFVADLIRSEAEAGLQVLVWTVFDGETDLIVEALGKLDGCEVLTGKTAEADRLATLERFRRGECRQLITRASMLGYGMNLQFVGSMIFSGWSDSFVRFFQALHRAWRDGQDLTRPLRVHVPVIQELEGDQLDNINRKWREHNLAVAEMENNYIAARRALGGEHGR